MRFKYFAARWAGVHLVCIPIASRSLLTAEYLAVRLKRQPVPNGPFVKQRWIVRELEQCGSNFLRLRHSIVHGIKARLFVCAFGICCDSQPPDISVTHMESNCADIYNVPVTHLRGASEIYDAAQISF